MLKNYLLIALRQFTRHKMFSVLNVGCLAIGISFCLLMGQYVLQQSSMNGGLKNLQQQYFLTSDWKVKSTGPELTTVGPLAKELKSSYPNLVANYYRYNPVVNVVSAGDQHFKEEVAIGDTTIISMYGYPLLFGNPNQAFHNNRSTVITETLAMKLFGVKNVIGKTVTFSNLNNTTQDYTVSAVLKTLPYTTPENAFGKDGFSMFIPFEGSEYYSGSVGDQDWKGFYIVSFLQLQPGVNSSSLAGPIKKLLATNSPENISKNLTVHLKPLDGYYLAANNGSIQRTVSILSIVAFGILLLAMINFVNIMIGTSSYRVREIGLRKVFGGRRKELIAQYLIESIGLTVVAAIVSLALYAVCRPLFNQVLDSNLPAVFDFPPRVLLALLGVSILTGIIAGGYPAFVLSGSNIVYSVKGKLESVDRGMWFRKSLLVLQFSIAIGVLIFSFTISRQVDYFFKSDLGYNKEQLMVITAFPKQWDSIGVLRMESVRNSLLGLSAVKDASVSFDIPERTPPNQFPMTTDGIKNNLPVSVASITVDEKFAGTFGLQVIEGRFFHDSTGIFTSGETVINEAARKALGWTVSVGRKIKFPDNGGDAIVVGVVKDFHLSSMQERIGPLMMFQVKDWRSYRFLTVKLNPGNLARSIEEVKAKWKEVSPTAPFEYHFMDEKLQIMYETEMQLKRAAGIATGLMLLIVMLGIFGVLSLALTQRAKEIAVRKVLGAGIRDILYLFVKQYAGLLLVACAIAFPLTYYFSQQWLMQYVYRIAQPLSIYVAGGLFVATIAFVLICLQCLKVALDNPVKSLRAE